MNPERMKYMSCSQLKRFCECEAAAMADLRGEWHQQKTEALAVGSLVDALVLTPEKALEVSAEHAEFLQLKKGGESAAAKLAWRCAERVLTGFVRPTPEDDPVPVKDILRGQPQVDVQGEIGGVPWRGKLDLLDLDGGMFLDLKTTRGFGLEWITGRDGRNVKVPWYEAWNYWRQLAVYQELVRQHHGRLCTPYLLAVSKEDPPNLDMLCATNTERLARELSVIAELMPHVQDVKTGAVPPVPCGICEDCRPRNIPVLRQMESLI